MRGSSLLLVVMLMMVTITGLGCAAQVSLTGTVTSAATGEPLHMVEVCAIRVEGANGLLLQPSTTARTDSQGHFVRYKIKDPSFHNWFALSLAMRNQEISDFPLCNKSFNLSYCGHDL